MEPRLAYALCLTIHPLSTILGMCPPFQSPNPGLPHCSGSVASRG